MQRKKLSWLIHRHYEVLNNNYLINYRKLSSHFIQLTRNVNFFFRRFDDVCCIIVNRLEKITNTWTNWNHPMKMEASDCLISTSLLLPPLQSANFKGNPLWKNLFVHYRSHIPLSSNFQLFKKFNDRDFNDLTIVAFKSLIKNSTVFDDRSTQSFYNLKIFLT